MNFQITKTQDTRYKQNSNSKIKIPKLVIGIWLLVIVWLLYLGNWSFAVAVSGNELVENARAYDGQVIEFQGEVIGDIMKRGDHSWLNVNDGSRAIGVWAKKGQVKGLKHPGDYKHIGDTIIVVGSFQRACSQHGGDLDIHAQRISIVAAGHKVKHPIDQGKLLLAVVLLIALLAVQAFFVWQKRSASKT